MPDRVSTVALHPWNRDFTWVDRAGPFSTLTAEQVAQFDELGYVVVPTLLDAELVVRVSDEIDGFEREVRRVPRDAGRRPAVDRRDRRDHVLARTWSRARRCCAN